MVWDNTRSQPVSHQHKSHNPPFPFHDTNSCWVTGVFQFISRPATPRCGASHRTRVAYRCVRNVKLYYDLSQYQSVLLTTSSYNSLSSMNIRVTDFQFLKIKYCCFSRLYPSFSILKRRHSVSGTDSVPAFRWKYLLCWVRQKGLIPISGDKKIRIFTWKRKNSQFPKLSAFVLKYPTMEKVEKNSNI
jgi:hypothetical protein